MKKLIHNKTTVVNINYHIIWCPKYRRKILVDEFVDNLNKELEETGNPGEYTWIELTEHRE